jgi:cytochrome c-type biogenesis protein CcmH/NrfF
MDYELSPVGAQRNATPAVLAWALPLVGFVCLALGAGVSLYAMRRRQEEQQRAERERQQV